VTSSPNDTTLRESPGSPVRARHRLIALCVASRPLAVPRSIDLEPGTVEIGRAGGPAPLGLDVDPRISRRHASLEIDETGKVELISAESSVTEVNGRPVARCELREGDVILLGESVLLLRDARGAQEGPSIEGIVGESPGTRAVRRSLAKVAPSPVSVLILGESGTGKEVAARALHDLSGRPGSFVAVNCAAIPATLAESQLFGHAAGSFTGAQKASPGVFRAADGGTLFLDELADLPLDLQPKLLRALEERTVVAVGTTHPIPVDVRVVTATNRDVIADVKAGRFRGDLYARLAEFTLHLPALRERREDILPILAHQYRAALPPLKFETIRALLVHPWPFNVRELRTIAAQLRLLGEGDGGPIGLSAIAERLDATARLHDGEPDRARSDRPPSGSPPAMSGTAGSGAPPPLAGGSPSSHAPPPTPSSPASGAPPADKRGPAPRDRAELEELLRTHKGNVTELAQASGRSRRQIYRWIDAHGIDLERFRDG
jgi:DNA-binding NtrC family response regulator